MRVLCSRPLVRNGAQAQLGSGRRGRTDLVAGLVPALEEGGFRWPRAGDLPTYAFALALAATILWWEHRKT